MRIVFIFNSWAICAAACQSRWKKSGVFNFAEQTRRGGLSRAVWSVSIFVFFLFSRPFFWLQPSARPPVNMCPYRKQEVPCVWLFRHSAFVVAGSDSFCLGCIRATLSAVLPCQGWTSPAMWPSWRSALSQTMSSVRKIWARHKPCAQRILHYPL